MELINRKNPFLLISGIGVSHLGSFRVGTRRVLVKVTDNYDGMNQDRVLFVKKLIGEPK